MLGVFLGMTLLSLLVMSRDSRWDNGLAPLGSGGQSMLNRGRAVVAAGSAGRAGGFPQTFSVKDPISASGAWEEFDPKTGGAC